MRDPLSNRAPLVPEFPYNSIALKVKNSQAGESQSSLNAIVKSGTTDSKGRKCIDKVLNWLGMFSVHMSCLDYDE